MKKLQNQLSEVIKNLEEIKEIQDKRVVFEQALNTIKKVAEKISVPRKDIGFVLNSLRGLLDGISEFTEADLCIEAERLLTVFKRIKDNLSDYIRNAVFKVPFGKKLLDLDLKHFESLVKIQSYDKVIRNLVDFKFDVPEIRKWVDVKLEHLKKYKRRSSNVGWKEQLADLKELGVFGTTEKKSLHVKSDQAEIQSSGFMKEAKTSIDLLSEDQKHSLIKVPVVINAYFNFFLKLKLERLGYNVQIVANQYTVVHNGSCFGVHCSFFDNPFAVKNKIKVNNNVGSIIRSKNNLITVQFEDGTKIGYSAFNPNIEVVENSYRMPIEDIMYKMDNLMRKHLKIQYYTIGIPLYSYPHYYWLCFELPEFSRSRIKRQTWSFFQKEDIN